MSAQQERDDLRARLAAKDRELEGFIYTVSHDLKSPLVTLHGFLGLLEKDLEEGRAERVSRDIERIQGAAQTMERLLDDLLELSRIGRMVNLSEEIDLSELAREAAGQVADRIAERGVEIEISPDMPSVFADRSRMLQLLSNLIDNAVKFMGAQPHPRVQVTAAEDGDEVVCAVRDNGIGIEPRFLEKIFGLFDRLDQNGEGTGIGLALVDRIVKIHDGRAWAESAGEGHGSAFFFALPRLAPKAGASGDPRPSPT